MSDLIYLGITAVFFLCQRAVRPRLRKTLTPHTSMETIIGGLVALLLFIYLLVAMLRPEKF